MSDTMSNLVHIDEHTSSVMITRDEAIGLANGLVSALADEPCGIPSILIGTLGQREAYYLYIRVAPKNEVENE